VLAKENNNAKKVEIHKKK